MARLLFGLGRWCFHRKKTVIAFWLLFLGVISGASSVLGEGFIDSFPLKDIPSIQAAESLEDNFPNRINPVTEAGVNIVFHAPDGQTLRTPQNSAAMDRVVEHIEQNMPDLTGTERFGNPLVVSPALEKMIFDRMTSMGIPEESARQDAANLAMVNADKTIAYTTFSVDVPMPQDVQDKHREVVNQALDIGRSDGFTVEAGGSGFGEPIKVKNTSELVGSVVAFIILFFTFGSLVAAGIPLVTALIGIAIGASGIVLATHYLELNSTTPVLAVMIGLAVGIDYALFILSRYKTECEKAPREVAIGMAVGTAGSSVVFAGATVIIALLALTVARIDFLTPMGLSAAVTVFIAVLIAITLLPALLGVLGSKAFSGRVPGVGGRQNTAKHRGRHSKWSRYPKWILFVQKFPGLIVAFVVLGLGALAIPTADLQLSLPSDSTAKLDSTQRKSADLLADGFGAGINSPFLIIVDAHNVNAESEALKPLITAQKESAEVAARNATFLYAVQTYNSTLDVKHAQLVDVNDDGTAAQILVTPYIGPADKSSTEMLQLLRKQEQQISTVTGATLGTTGFGVVQQDISDRLDAVMPLYLAVVVGLAFILLLLVFRSVLVPLIAGLGFLLSVGAAAGITVLVWQQGLWGIVDTPGPLISFMPIFLIGVTFGLAMDYQVFLVSRMREQYNHYRKNNSPDWENNAVDKSVIEGFSAGARVVVAAALIMIAVFIAFLDQPIPFIQIFGFALALAVFFDAFFVRMALVPATMFLMGRATWWIPRWLDKILPHVDVEGTALEKPDEQNKLSNHG